MTKPITDYNAFRNYQVSIDEARRVCSIANLPSPKSVARIGRGEVSALFLLKFDASQPVILKVFVRPPGPKQMETGLLIAKQLDTKAGVPSPQWLHAATPDEIIPFPYAVLSFAHGEDGDELWKTLKPAEKVLFARSCGKALQALHTAGLSIAGPSSAADWLAAQKASLQEKIDRHRQQGWLSSRLLDAAKDLSSEWPSAADLSMSFVHYDFQLHNLRVDPTSFEVTSILDFDNATMAPAFTDARDLTVSVLHESTEAREAFWDAYGPIGPEERSILRLHCLVRVLGVLASYHGPTGFLSENTVARLVSD